MYCVRKFADCWAVFNLDNDTSRRLTEHEVGVLRQAVPELDDPLVAAHYTDRLESINDKP